MYWRILASILAVFLTTARAQIITQAKDPLVLSAGDKAILLGWNLQSTLDASNDLTALSLPGADVSSWYRVGSQATVMAGLIQNGIYNETDLFYSSNMETAAVDPEIFNAPWLYREEFTIPDKPVNGQHFFLSTHGITSKADIYLNGALVALNTDQKGSYAGHTYDVTANLRQGSNSLLVQAYPTNYLRDFAVGFADWNPYPADNGTGIWRDIEISQTGPVSISSPRVLTNFTSPDNNPVTVTVNTDVSNHENQRISGTLQGSIQSDDKSQTIALSQNFQLNPHETKTIPIAVELSNPRTWWPAQWGEQSLYKIRMNATLSSRVITDIASTKKFGIRHVASYVNSYNDTAFTVNGSPFLVLGAGYAPDLFLRFDPRRVQIIFRYMLDMGLNTVRLEGKQEHQEFYDLADEMGIMVLAGWECCDKWEGWEYNEDAPGDEWTPNDYPIASATMLHEAALMQTHPSMLGFLLGSDFWPNDEATNVYLEALNRMDWPNPVIASASKRGYPQSLGPSGMKMHGPYDWVPPNYFYGDKLGAAFGFGSEEGAGVGTPELTSLKRFLSPSDLEALWKSPDQSQYHMSRSDSQFHNRKIYNEALFARYGQPNSLVDYVRKAQMMDYEATRAQFEAFSIRQNATRPSTGVIYWMLNSAWPNLHWQLFDYYLSQAGAYFGAKVGARPEHVAYDYQQQAVYLINHLLGNPESRVISVDLMDLNGRSIFHNTVVVNTTSNASKPVITVSGIDQIQDIGFLRLYLQDPRTGTILSRNVYWLSARDDLLDWDNSTWYHTPVAKYADYTALSTIPTASLATTVRSRPINSRLNCVEIVLQNNSPAPVLFLHLSLVDQKTQEDIIPAYWSDNYVTIFPGERITLEVVFTGKWNGKMIVLSGENVEKTTPGSS